MLWEEQEPLGPGYACRCCVVSISTSYETETTLRLRLHGPVQVWGECLHALPRSFCLAGPTVRLGFQSNPKPEHFAGLKWRQLHRNHVNANANFLRCCERPQTWCSRCKRGLKRTLGAATNVVRPFSKYTAQLILFPSLSRFAVRFSFVWSNTVFTIITILPLGRF